MLTILLPSTAPSVLSRRSGSVCATLLTGKMIPADLGRFFRPYGAEHMHAHPPPEPEPHTHTHTHTHTRVRGERGGDRQTDRERERVLFSLVSSV